MKESTPHSPERESASPAESAMQEESEAVTLRSRPVETTFGGKPGRGSARYAPREAAMAATRVVPRVLFARPEEFFGTGVFYSLPAKEKRTNGIRKRWNEPAAHRAR